VISALARSFSVITIAIVLSACSSAGDDAVKEAGSRENSFPGAKNPGSDFSETSTGDTSNANGLARNEVRITVEVPEQMAPEGPLSRRNLHLVQPDSVRVYKTDQNLRALSSVDVTTRTDDDGFNVIGFPNGQPLGPDVLIEVSYQGQTIRAFATDNDRDIKVNPFSEYLVIEGLGGYTELQFEQAMACVNSTDSTNLCINKYIWSTLADQVQDFEIDIPDNTGFDSAVALLGQRADFARYVSEMAKIILITPADTSTISGDSVNMNTVFHGLELGITGTGTSGPGRWGIRRSAEERVEVNGVGYVYPGLSMSSLGAFGITATFLASDIPYQRATLTQFSAANSVYLGPDNWDINSHATTAVPGSIKNDTQLLAGLSVLQTITNKNSAKIIGWTRNPYRLDALVVGGKDDPQALVSGYFSAGRSLELKADNGGYQRGDQLEEYFVSIFDLSFTKSDDFQISTLSSSYNVISFSTQLGDPVTPFRTESMLGTWSGSGGSFTQTASAEEINRKANGTVTTASPNRDGPANVSNQTSQLSGGDKNTGRLSLDSSAIGQVGASQPDGSLLAFNLDNPVNGDGVLIALKAGSEPPEADRNYRLQGTIVGLNDDKQILQHIDGGQLSIGTAGDATVSLAGFEVTQTVSTQVLERPHALTTTTDADLTFTFTSGATPQLVMTKTGGASPYLQGFVSEDGSLLMLQIRERPPSGDEYLGLLIGVLEAP
tara:strand:+ start:14706 stop:16865 length:2160 start_codon:yes stop_codon:yes gene_type:complete